MAENARANGQQFGRMVVQTELGEAFSLDLFETPDLVCRGFYFPPSRYHARYDQPRPEAYSDRPLLATPEIELRALQAVIEELQRTLDIQTHGEQNAPFFGVYADRFEIHGALACVSPGGEAGTEVWTGQANGAGEMSFVLERYGSPDVFVLITAIVLLIWGPHMGSLEAECWNRAMEMCGEQGIKRYKVHRNLMDLPRFGRHVSVTQRPLLSV
jgi:hypothetical protein